MLLTFSIFRNMCLPCTGYGLLLDYLLILFILIRNIFYDLFNIILCVVITATALCIFLAVHLNFPRHNHVLLIIVVTMAKVTSTSEVN